MLNVVALMGRLVADPELRHTPNDIPVTTFTLAVDRAYSKDKEKQADFIEIVAWRGTAEFVCKYFGKGRMIAVTGSIQTRGYEDKQGNKRKAVEILASEVSFADSKRDNATQTGEPEISVPPRPKAFSEPAQGYYEQEILSDDDLPF